MRFLHSHSVAVPALVIIFFWGSLVAAADPVRISVTNQNISFLPAGVALKKGYFKDEGLEVEIIRMNTPNTITTLITGDIGYTLLLGSVVRGMPLKVAGSLLDSPTHALIARSEVKSVKDLRGRTIGIGNFGGTDEVVARMMFKHFGIDPKREVKMIAVGPDRAWSAALKENLVAASIIAPPADMLGKDMGFGILARGYEVFKFPSQQQHDLPRVSRQRHHCHQRAKVRLGSRRLLCCPAMELAQPFPSLAKR
jgi:ABC-type nitrate/sulfonate/bicarbonate transport system substrate-binding protein